MNFLQLQNEVIGTRFHTSQREQVKNWINNAYVRMWTAADWPFKKAQENVTVTASVSTVSGTPIDKMIRPISIHTDDGEPLTYVTPREYDVLRPPRTNTTGIPQWWTLIDRDVILAPLPAETSTVYTMRYELRLGHYDVNGDFASGPMAADGDTPFFDEEWHYILVSGALAIGLKMENDSTWDLAETDFLSQIETMQNYYLPVQLGENRSYGGGTPGGGY